MAVILSAFVTPAQYTPADYGFLGWSYDPTSALGASNSPVNGAVQAVRIKVAGGTISNLWLGINAAGVGLTAGQNFAGLYNSTGQTLLSATADQTTPWASGFTAVQMALTTPQVVPPGFVYVAWFSNAVTSTPKFQWANSANMDNANLATGVARFATGGGGATTALPASLTLAKTADAYWCAVS